jgi:hypothetical protein
VNFSRRVDICDAQAAAAKRPVRVVGRGKQSPRPALHVEQLRNRRMETGRVDEPFTRPATSWCECPTTRAHERGPYVFEHILVVEELLGRNLKDGESIHHRNGVRDDSRPENLELWTRPQPSGIRVSDAIEWARAILDRYETGGPGAPPTVLTERP